MKHDKDKFQILLARISLEVVCFQRRIIE